MRTSLNLSVSLETFKKVEEMKKKGIKPSHIFKRLMDELGKKGYELPVTIDNPDSAI